MVITVTFPLIPGKSILFLTLHFAWFSFFFVFAFILLSHTVIVTRLMKSCKTLKK